MKDYLIKPFLLTSYFPFYHTHFKLDVKLIFEEVMDVPAFSKPPATETKPQTTPSTRK